MQSSFNNVRGLLLGDGPRAAGSMVKDGKEVAWPDGYVISLLQLGGSKSSDIRRITVRQGLENSIKAQLANVNWGCLISVELEGNRVVSVDVGPDLLAHILTD